MTLTYKLGLDILLLDLYTEIQVCMSIRLVVRVVTDTHTDTENNYTRHGTDMGCNEDKMS